MKNYSVVLVLIICLGGFAVGNAQTKPKQTYRWLDYEPSVVSLKGKLVVKRYYGPPNFGENPKTDEKEDMPVLLLSEPVNVRGKNESGPAAIDDESVKNVREMALVLRMPHKNLIGRTVIIKGTLFHAFTGHHHTAVLMDVQSINAARSQK
jgi:hypothetical protein